MSFSPRARRQFASATVAILVMVPTSLALSATLTGNLPPKQSSANEKAAMPRSAQDIPQVAALASPISTVALVRSKTEVWPDQIEATGNIMPWHENSISTEVGGLRIESILVNEGDIVKKGQVLARLNAATVETDLDVANAQLEEATAVLSQATATLERANRLAPSGGVSRQDLTLYETQKHTAEARLNAARAQAKRQQLKLEFATLSAPDDGVISSSSASEGAIVQTGSELFRLIRQGRLEWRAEVKGDLLMKVTVGQEIMIKSPLGPEIKGHVRRISPTVDLATRNGLVYVDLPQGTVLKAGQNVSGILRLGKRKALVIPSSAVLNREGKALVFKVDANGRLEPIEVKIGRFENNQVEVVTGLDDQTLVVSKDLHLMKAGELVKAQMTNSENVQP